MPRGRLVDSANGNAVERLTEIAPLTSHLLAQVKRVDDGGPVRPSVGARRLGQLDGIGQINVEETLADGTFAKAKKAGRTGRQEPV